ncbi:MAG TPA: cytochrome c-type biogenesis protein [Caulobacteraceae bacterium]|nr:cytochrome c-type biogenesis protein [Caulobacteraceae bacterium]
MKRRLAALAAVLCMAAASDPSERLPDPAQEARARALFQDIRCVVCQNESIDDSEADLARDMRSLVREQVAAGRTDAEVRAYLLDRYGEFVLLTPRFNPANALLWLTPLAILLGASGFLWMSVRRARASDPAALSPEEEARLAALTNPLPGGHASAQTSPQEQPHLSER